MAHTFRQGLIYAGVMLVVALPFSALSQSAGVAAVAAVAAPPAEVVPSPESGTAPPVLAVWSRPLRATDLAFPKAAWNAGISGRVELQCVVSDAKAHVTCTVVSEDPEGYGFGEAAVKGIEKIRAGKGVPVGTHMKTPPFSFTYTGPPRP